MRACSGGGRANALNSLSLRTFHVSGGRTAGGVWIAVMAPVPSLAATPIAPNHRQRTDNMCTTPPCHYFETGPTGVEQFRLIGLCLNLSVECIIVSEAPSMIRNIYCHLQENDKLPYPPSLIHIPLPSPLGSLPACLSLHRKGA